MRRGTRLSLSGSAPHTTTICTLARVCGWPSEEHVQSHRTRIREPPLSVVSVERSLDLLQHLRIDELAVLVEPEDGALGPKG